MKAHSIGVNYRQAVGLNYLGCFFNNFMLGLSGGDIVKAYYASKLTSRKKAQSATIVFIDRLFGSSGLLVLGIAAVVSSISDERMRPALVIVFVAVLLFVILGLFAFNRTFARKFGKYIRHGGIREAIKKVYDAVYFYKSRGKVLAEALALSILVWTLLILMNFQLANGLGMEVPVGYFFVFIPVINIISCVPITIAGWGLREQMYKQFFCPVGMSEDVAVSLSIIFALIILTWSLVGGVLYALHLPKVTAHEDEKTIDKRVKNL